ncbi:MAG: DUF1800 domain-containing protein [Pseudomonadota bacterium]
MSRDAAIATNRFGLGAHPGELAAIDDPRRWLKSQLNGRASVSPALTNLGSSTTVLAEIIGLRQERNAMRKAGKEPTRMFGQTVRQHYAAQVLARYRAAATTSQPFRERLVHFFANHFAVSADKQPLPALAGLFENEAIRPHVTGRFADMLIAAEQHPAMLTYLDNQRSLGPNSVVGKRAARRRPDRNLGLNENLAREILELHTLGVDGGYTQTDVTSFAKVITGWSIGAANDKRRDTSAKVGAFYFRAPAHEPGTKTVVGKRYADGGVEQGIAVLKDLAVHPATARHVATKLARHFVADEPPTDLVDALTAAWLDSDGDLDAVARTLVDHDSAWRPERQKYKSTHDFVISTFRALNHEPDNAKSLFGMLEQLGQPPYRPGSPAGWPDTAAYWGSADGLYKRIEWAGAVGSMAGRQTKPLSLARAVVGPSLSAATTKAIAGAASGEQGLTLVFASPEFLRR